MDVDAALERVRTLVTDLDPTPGLPGAQALRAERDAAVDLLDGYLIRRLGQPDRPLLVVIGGPTGAGKSTLLNSLVGVSVSTPGVIRPTTRTPVLLHHPDDAEAANLLFPGLQASAAAVHENVQLSLVVGEDVPPGLMLLDSPDLDSWLSTNREVAARFIELADLWVFVTTGTDYANGVPWDMLRQAVGRQVSIAAGLNRLRRSEMTAVPQHFAKMLVDEGLGGAPLVQVADVDLFEERIPYRWVEPLHDWLGRQTDDAARAEYLDRAGRGSLAALSASLERLVDACGEQVKVARRLRADLQARLTVARRRIDERVSVLTPGVAAAWRECRPVTDTVAGRRQNRRAAAALRAAARPYDLVGEALAADVGTVVAEEVATALEAPADRWDGPPPADPELPGRARGAVAHWLDAVEADLDLPEPPVPSRWQPATLALATAALGSPDTLPAAAELPPDGDVGAAREALWNRIEDLVAAEERRVAERVDRAAISAGALTRLDAARAELDRIRTS